MTKQARIEWLEQWMFNLLCAFSLFSSLSNGLTNVSLGLICPLFLYRLYLGDIDWRSAIRVDHGIFGCFAAFFVVSFLATLGSPEFGKGFMVFLNYYIYRMLPFFINDLGILRKTITGF